MWWYLLILFPALVAIVWSVAVKVRVKAWRDMVDMLVCAVAAVVNVLFVCFAFQHDSLPTCGLLIRQLVSVIILPSSPRSYGHRSSSSFSREGLSIWTIPRLTSAWSAIGYIIVSTMGVSSSAARRRTWCFVCRHGLLLSVIWIRRVSYANTACRHRVSCAISWCGVSR